MQSVLAVLEIYDPGKFCARTYREHYFFSRVIFKRVVNTPAVYPFATLSSASNVLSSKVTFLTAFEFEQSSWVLTEVKITTFQKFAVDIFVVATPAVAKLHDPGKKPRARPLLQ